MIEFKNLTFFFEKGTKVLNDVDLAINSGDCLLLAGPNGSGKTVLMKHCNGLLKQQSGKVLYRGRSVHSQLKTVRQRIGIAFQNSDTQFVGQTVREDIAFGPENLGWDKERVENAVYKSAEFLHITHLLDNYPHFLSGGEKKRAAIAGIIAMDPECIIMDEPFAGLDYQGVCDVTKEIKKLKDSGHTLVIITHDIEKALALSSRMVIMNEGRIVYDGRPVINKRLYHDNGLRIPYGKQRSIGSCTWL